MKFLLCALLAASCLAQTAPAFRADVNLVNVSAVVRSPDGKLLSELGKDDFEVFEDGVPQKIQFFARETDLPLSLGLIIDISSSQDPFTDQHNRDLASFLQAVLRPADNIFAVGFGNHVRLIEDKPASLAELIEEVKRFSKHPADYPEIGPHEDRDLGTALYDAIYFPIRAKLSARGERRRALIVFSDGEENASEHDLLDAISEAQDTDTLIYGVRYTQKKHGKLTARNRYGIRVMDHLSNLTGGLAFDAQATDLASVFGQIGEELRSTYRIGYVSTNEARDGSFRKVTLHCAQAGTVVRAKSGYYSQ